MTREEAIEYIKSKCIGSETERDRTQWSDAMWTAIEALQDLSKPNNTCEVDLISRQDAIDALMNDSDWADAIPTIKSLPSADRPTDEEDQLKFYYVESIDDYWIGQRLDNFYYADWHKGLGFVWSKSRYLPWGEHIVDENTLWKEHTYPSEPVEIPFTDWIDGVVQKYFAEPKTGEWVRAHVGTIAEGYYCSRCGKHGYQTDFCPNCGAKMFKGGEEE